jgi:hypothetical protein
MLIDCDRCELRGAACGDCAVTALAECGQAPGGAQVLGAQEMRALSVLAAAGMVPPLRFRPARDLGAASVA